MERNSIGIIGYGTMGAAIAQQIKNDYSVFIFDTDDTKTREVMGMMDALSLSALFASVATVVIAVKPQDMRQLLEQIKAFATEKHIFISIAAGVQTCDIEAYLAPLKVKIVRVMPNLLIRIGKGVSCLCAGKNATLSELAVTEKIFSQMGQVRRIPENLMDTATALFGSAPGYESYLIETQNIDVRNEFIPALTAIVQDKLKFFPSDSRGLVGLTAMGTLELIKQVGSPATLYKQVASKGGTTEAIIEVLKNGGSLKDAIEAGIQRARQLAKMAHVTMQGE